jgi:hypothetical protein
LALSTAKNLKKGIGRKAMTNDIQKDHWSRLLDIAVRIDDRSFKSDNLRNPAYSPQAIVSASHDLFGTVADMDDAIARLKLDAKAIAENLKLPDAMAMLHEVGLVVHKASQR